MRTATVGRPTEARPTYGLDADRCYLAVRARDPRFDGVFYTGVLTTGIYCRPSCPSRTPGRDNVVFLRTAAAAQAAGFRACRRCLPDRTPGSPEWDLTGDIVGRAMRLLADGVVEREGVDGLASRLGYTTRHLNRLLTDRLGAGPLALARSQRAHLARILIETTSMRMADVAFAAGFASVRQFNATIRQIYAATPVQLRRARRPSAGASPGLVTVQLAVREPFAAGDLLEFLGARAIAGVEDATPGAYTRTMRLGSGHGTVRLTPSSGSVVCQLALTDLRDLGSAVERCRRLLDLDADPVAIDEHLLEGDLTPWVRKRPGIRVPGSTDGFETAVRAVVGQQVSVAAARSVLGRLTERYGDAIDPALGGRLTRLFPTAAALGRADPAELPMPRARGATLVGLARAVDAGEIVLDRGADRGRVHEALLALPGIGPWTAGYVAMRALGDPDVLLAGDLGIRSGWQRMAPGSDLATAANRWRPWRSYALMHIWAGTAPRGKAA